MVAAQTQPWKEELCGCFTVPIAGRKGWWGQTAKAARLLFRPPAAPAQGKGLGLDQCRGAFGSCRQIVLITLEGRWPDNCIQGTVTASTAEPSGINWQPHGDKECFSGWENALPNRSVSFKLASLGSNCSFQGKQLLLTRGSLAGKFKCLAVIWDNRKVHQGIQVVNWHLSWQGVWDRQEALCH